MKQILSLILVFILSVSLCSCSTESVPDLKSEDNTVPNTDKIEFANPIILVDDSFLRVEVTNFFQELSVGLGSSEKDKYITLKMENRTDHNLLVILDQLSINNNGADVFRGSTSTEIPPKGDIVKYFRIRIDESTPLNAMEDLFQLRGTLTVYRCDLNGERTNVKTAHFYVAESFASGPSSANKTNDSAELSIGDTAQTDMAEFTLTGLDFQYELYLPLLNKLVHPDEGMVYAVPEFTMQNTAKESYSLEKVINFTVDYNDGYLYEMDDYVCYITHEKGAWERRKIGTSSGQRPELPPLMSGTYRTYIPAVSLIETDDNAPLRIVVTLPASGGTQQFIYRIR